MDTRKHQARAGRRSRTGTTLLLAASAMFTTFATPASALAAGPVDEGPALVVNIRNFDLRRPEDARVVYALIRKAADIVCRRRIDRDPAITPEHWSCINHAITQAVESIQSPVLTRIHRHQSSEKMESASAALLP